MSCKGCKDKKEKCNDCQDFIYRRIEQPDCYDFSIDTSPYNSYIYPINDFEGNMPKNIYDNIIEYNRDYAQYLVDNMLPYTIALPYGGARSYFETVEEGLIYYATLPTQSFAANFRIIVRNRNYNTYVDEHPSVLKTPVNYYSNALNKPYSTLETPTWLLKFPLCGVSGNKDMGWQTFKVNKKCKNYKVEYKLRLRPITYVVNNNDSFPCVPLGLKPEGIPNNYESYKSYVDMIGAMQTNEGHKWLGFTPLRLESGIYSHLKNKYEPVIWSDWGYPQNMLAYGHRYWHKQHPDKMTCIPCGQVLYTRPVFADLQNLEMSPNVTISNDTIQRIYMSNDEVLYYNYNPTYPKGFFRGADDNINKPGYITLNHFSQNVGGITDKSKINPNRITDKLQKYMKGYLPATGPNYPILDITLQYLIDGEWTDVLNVDYNIYSIYKDNESFSFGVYATTINSYDSTYVTLTGGLSGPNQFIKDSEHQHRYVFDVAFNRKVSTTLPFSTANVKLPNYSRLMDDFVYEIEGFVDVDMENETDISIYLKALPDNHQTVDIGLKNKPNFFHTYGLYDDDLLTQLHMDTANCSANVVVDDCYPWGTLSMDGRTGWKTQDEVHYEPLLPLKYTHINDDNLSRNHSELARQVYRWGMGYSPYSAEFAIMIEDGWIRITPDCDDCCD